MLGDALALPLRSTAFRDRSGRLIAWMAAALLIAGCHSVSPEGAVTPMATVTGTVLIPSAEATGVDPALVSGASSGSVPVAFARVQALDGSLRPIPGLPETRTDAGGHFALDVPTGRPYILRFQVGGAQRPMDLLAVADPTDGSGAQVITVDAAMHVATQLLLDRTDGLDSALDAVGASDVKALVDAVRQSLSGQPVDLDSAQSVDDLAEQEAQADGVENVLARVDRATSQATASAAAADLEVMSNVASSSPLVPVTAETPVSTPDVPVADVASPAPTPLPAAPPPATVAMAPAPAATPRSRPGPDRRSIEWAQEFSFNLGPAVDPFRAALQRAEVSVAPFPLPIRRRGERRPVRWRPSTPGSRHSTGTSPAPARRIAATAQALPPSPARHRLSAPSSQVVQRRRPGEHCGPLARAGAKGRVTWWRTLVSGLFGWLPSFRLPTLPPG